MKSLVKRGESLMALAYIFLTSGAKSAAFDAVRAPWPSIPQTGSGACARRFARMSARWRLVASRSATGKPSSSSVEHDAEDALRGFPRKEAVLDIPGGLDRIALKHVAIAAAAIVGMAEDVAGLVRRGDVWALRQVTCSPSKPALQFRSVRVGAGVCASGAPLSASSKMLVLRTARCFWQVGAG